MISAAATTDPLNVFQWAYQNLGYENGQVGLDTGVHAVPATGAGTIIAIASTGADYTHEDLQNALWVNPNEIADNGIDDDANGYVDDIHGPGPMGSGDTFDELGTGTALTGIIAASRDNGVGISGLAPGAKVLSCNTALPTGQLSVVDIILCIDYVIDQKLQHGQNIRVFLAGFRGFFPFDQIIEPAMRALQNADITVIAPTYMVPPGPYARVDLDATTDSPATMDFANILAISASDRRGLGAFRTSGYRTVHSVLPGVEILTTLPGFIGEIDGTGIIAEEFNAPPAGWVTNGGWTHASTGGVGDSGSMQLTVGSGDIFSNDQTIELPPIDVSSIPIEQLRFSFRLWIQDLVNVDPPYLEAAVELQWYDDVGDHWNPAVSDNDNKQGPAWQKITGSFAGTHLDRVDLSTFRLRIRATTMAEHEPIIILDDLLVGPEPVGQGAGNSYRYFNGTGAAGAVAAAMIAILHEMDPNLSNAQLRNLVTSSGTEYIGVAGQPESPGPGEITRIGQLWNSDGTGATQCSGQLSDRRTKPLWARDSTLYVGVGQPLQIDSRSIDCANAGQVPMINELVGGNTLVMRDDGMDPDALQGDGVFVAEWASATAVNETLEFSENDSLNVLALEYYDAIEVPFQWREMQEAPEYPSTHLIDPPFPIRFGGLDSDNAFETPVGLGHDPGISLNGWFVNGSAGFMLPDSPGTIRNDPSVGPLFGWFQLIPYYTKHLIDAPRLRWSVPENEVQGEAPNREWIVEYLDYNFDQCDEGSISIQLVLFENSPDLLVNVRDVVPDCDGNPMRPFLMHNFDSWQVFDAIDEAPASILFTAKASAPNSAPELASEIPTQTIVHGETLALNISSYFSDPDGDALTFFLGRASQYVAVDPDGNLTAKFPFHAPTDIPLKTLEVGAHDGQLATRARFEVIFDNSANEPPQLVQALPEFTGPVGEFVSYDLQQYFFDPDGDPLEFIHLGPEDELLLVNPNGRVVVRATSDGQTDSKDFLVTDGEFALQATVTGRAFVKVATAPVQILPIPDQVVRAGEYFRLPIHQYFDSDGGISYTTDSGWPADGDIEFVGSPDVLHAIFPTQTPINTFTPAIRAGRQGTVLSTTVTFNLTVLQANRLPTLDSVDPIEVAPGAAATIRLDDLISDADNDPIYYVVTDLPPGLEETSPGVITGSLQNVGQYSFSVRATDAAGGSLVTTIDVTVAQAAPPPTQPPGNSPRSGGGGGALSLIEMLSLLSLIACLSLKWKSSIGKQARRQRRPFR